MQCSITFFWEGGGGNPLWCLSTPQVFIDPTILVKNSQKYIAGPPLVLPQSTDSVTSMPSGTNLYTAF